MSNDAREQPKKAIEPEPGRKEPANGQGSPSPAGVCYGYADLRGCDMAGQSLEYADFRAAKLQGVNFSGCNLSYTDFRGANAVGANFQKAKLYGAKMQGLEAFHADFRHSDLRGAHLGGAYLDGAAMPPPERLATPGEINGTKPEKSLQEDLAEKRNRDQDGNARNDQAPSRSLPGEQRDKGRGRGR